MTQEEKQILLKDLCARLPYGVKMLFNDKRKFILSQINPRQYAGKDGYGVIFDFGGKIYSVEDCKPYLRPMSSMTEEEFKMVCSMNALTDTELRDRINFPNMFVKSYTIETFDLFNSHHFDYRGLIEKGLALEAPVDMYKTD